MSESRLARNILLILAVAAWLAAVALTARIGITFRTGFDSYRYEHALPFIAVWAVVTTATAMLLNRRLMNAPGLVPAGFVVGVLVAFLLYYGIGRPMELRTDRTDVPPTSFVDSFRPAEELLLPVAMGLLPAAVLSVAFAAMGLAGRGRDRQVPRSRALLTGLATYLILGGLLWLHAFAAWATIGFWTGTFPVPDEGQWIRFADEVGPRYALWYPAAWPWLVIACCG